MKERDASKINLYFDNLSFIESESSRDKLFIIRLLVAVALIVIVLTLLPLSRSHIRTCLPSSPLALINTLS